MGNMKKRKYISFLTKDLAKHVEMYISANYLDGLRDISDELAFRKKSAALDLNKKISHYFKLRDHSDDQFSKNTISELLD